MPPRSAVALAIAFLAAGAVAPHAPAGTVAALSVKRVANGMNRPIYATHAPDDETRLFIVEQRGVIRILDLATETLLAASFLNINSVVGGPSNGFDERGLLGLAFHPDYQTNGFFFVNYTNNSSNTVIARYEVLGDPATSNTADSSSGVTILTINQPQTNHNGGWLGFSPLDGHLYIGTGDGGGGCDDDAGHTGGTGNGQDITNMLLGKMLRIDPSLGVGGGYTIPASNPFVGQTGDDEIWASGLRNPWRPSFDRDNGDLYIADVGQSNREEINYQPFTSTGKENYGWRCFEGVSCGTISCPLATPCNCAAGSLTFPIRQYNHGTPDFSCSITGGYTYRGCDIPSLDGTYFYADFCSDKIWSFLVVAGNDTEWTDRTAELEPPGNPTYQSISSFGEDARGEIYIIDRAINTNSTNSGEVYRIIRETGLADFDCNGFVGVNDWLALTANWGPCSGACPWDLTRDGLVGVDDWLLVLAQWGVVP